MPARTSAPTAHGQRTRERLLRATADLVAARGFHAVGIAEIGAAAGVTGSAIYRHFGTKQELLAALFDNVIEGLLDGARRAQVGASNPEEVLDMLVSMHVDFALSDRTILRVYHQEEHNLPAADRRQLRRKQRSYADAWVDVLCRSRPRLGRADAVTAVHATFGLLNSVANFRAPLESAALAAALSSMAHGALRESAPARRV